MGTIQIKRGNNANVAALALLAGEPAFVTDTGKLYVGNGTTKVLINPDPASNSATASQLQTARAIAISGDVSGTANFDGSTAVNIIVALPASGVTAGTYTKLTVDAKGRVTAASNILATDIPTLTLAKISDAGTAASKNIGTAAGNIPLLDGSGKLDTSILPALAITDTFVVASQVAMLAVTAEVGDVAVRTDINKTFILKVAGASTLANWQEMLTPTDAVSSVAGKSGAVTLVAGDVGLGNVQNVNTTTTSNITDSTDKRFMSDAQEVKVDALAGTNTGDETLATIKTKLGITTLSGANTGDQVIPTTLPASSASSAVIITGLGFTPYNATNPSGYITAASNIDGGTF